MTAFIVKILVLESALYWLKSNKSNNVSHTCRESHLFLGQNVCKKNKINVFIIFRIISTVYFDWLHQNPFIITFRIKKQENK